MRSRLFTSRFDEWRIIHVLTLLLLVFTLSAGCADEEHKAAAPTGPVCDAFDVHECSCSIGKGYSYCLDDGSGFGQCQCAVKEAVPGPDTVEIPRSVATKSSLVGKRDLLVPLAGNERLTHLAAGTPVLCWDLNVMGCVTSAQTQGDRVLIKTEECSVTKVFDKLDIDYEGKAHLLAHMPENLKTLFRAKMSKRPTSNAGAASAGLPGRTSSLSPTATGTTTSGPPLLPNRGGTGSVDLLSAADMSTPGISVNLTGSYDYDLTMKLLQPKAKTAADVMNLMKALAPDVYLKLRFGPGKGVHFAAAVTFDPDIIMDLTGKLKGSATLTAEVDLAQLIVAIITDDAIKDFKFAIPLVAGWEIQFNQVFGAQVTLDASVETTVRLSLNGVTYGGLAYSTDWNDSIWDDAPSWFQKAKSSWADKTWQHKGYSNFNLDAQLKEFKWEANGSVETYTKAIVGLSFLKSVTGKFDLQPYFRAEASVGNKNTFKQSLGIRGHVGGEVSIFGQYTVWSDSVELFDLNYPIYQYSWRTCGDGLRTVKCDDDCTDMDYCFFAGCAGKAEECDPGIMFLGDREGYPEGINDKPCISPIEAAKTGETPCTCRKGWIPANGHPGEHYIGQSTTRDDWRWKAKNNYCIPSCGNGIVETDEGEECDDGDDDNCNGCSNTCKKNRCGDGIKCGTEECDDGNDNDCDDCGNDCTLVEGFNDGHTCGDEECDDGNWDDCDGCTITAKKNRCGDGAKCGTEECDDGNDNDCDNCHNDCTIGKCGDGIKCGNEECDDGNDVDCDTCSNDCKLVTGCGDHIVCTKQGEQCDDGNSDDCDSCHNDCKLNLHQCGDSHVCDGEKCDDGNNVGGDHCSPNCMSDLSCGNGVVDPAETCEDTTAGGVDQGCTAANPDCSADCKSCTPRCGDGLVGTGETCEDTTSGGVDKGCSAANPDCSGDCQSCKARCGDGVKGTGEKCDNSAPGNQQDVGCLASAPACDGTCSSCAVDCNVNTCGDGFVCAGEACDDGDTDDCDTCHNDCTLNTHQHGDGHVCDGEACDDGDQNDCNACHNDGTVNQNLCGDKYVCGSEICDDGNNTSGDGCSSDCKSNETCGNGIVDIAKGEVCDDSNTTSGDGCRGDCLGTEQCGDGLLDAKTESCEDNQPPDKTDLGCPSTSPLCLPNCAGCTTRICGDGAVQGVEVCDSDTKPCADIDGYKAGQACLKGCDGYGACAPLGRCGDGVVNGPEICDDGDQDSCTTACSADCKNAGVSDTPNCGNGILDCGEACDDGNTISGDGCSDDCTVLEHCGDAVTDSGEACDDGNTDNCHGNCNADCSAFMQEPKCGNGIVEAPCELCEDTVENGVDQGCTADKPNCAGCSTCSTEVCGDGVVSGDEVCDNGGTCNASEVACTTLNWKTVCVGVNDTKCDIYNTNSCSADCRKVPLCGDGIIDYYEICEHTAGGGAIGCSATRSKCSSDCKKCLVP